VGIAVYLIEVSPNTRIEINSHPRSTMYMERIYTAS